MKPSNKKAFDVLSEIIKTEKEHKAHGYIVTWDEFDKGIKYLLKQIKKNKYDYIIAILRGGEHPGKAIAKVLHLPIVYIKVSSYEGRIRKRIKVDSWYKGALDIARGKVLICDDILESGSTLKYISRGLKKNKNVTSFDTCVLYDKKLSKITPTYCYKIVSDWVIFPWERD